MLKKIIKKIASFFAIGSVAASASIAIAKDLPSLPVTELHVIDQKIGKGITAKKGETVSVHYTGWLFNPKSKEGHGKKFDSSRDRGRPFEFSLGAGMVIQGWDIGVQDMKEGGLRTLIIPASMGYGARGAGGVIPPNATLIFDVELIKIK
jgi:FKBP-type peptidyl-prolyl cis-trans isomerase